jgi:hypothetical protein
MGTTLARFKEDVERVANAALQAIPHAIEARRSYEQSRHHTHAGYTDPTILGSFRSHLRAQEHSARGGQHAANAIETFIEHARRPRRSSPQP